VGEGEREIARERETYKRVIGRDRETYKRVIGRDRETYKRVIERETHNSCNFISIYFLFFRP
jgi:hypothetical protein